MGEFGKKVFGQIQDFLKGLSGTKKVAMAVIFLGIVATIAGLFFWAGDTTYVNLMTARSPEDASNVMRILREKHIPFKVDPSGKAISVPPENLYDLRFDLAMSGQVESNVVGYEVFDKQSLGTTSFVQKVNQKRALEGELMRTINTIKGVKRSRVHLAIPQKSTFVEDQKKSTASVILDLEPGTVLNERQVYGIGNLVARAVEGMEVADVAVMDSNGKVISKNPSDPLAAATASQLDFQQKVEMDMEKRIEEILGRVVGDGRVVAKVSAELDFNQTHETQTLYDGDGSAVRSVEKRSESMNGTRPGPYGLAGASSNQPGTPPAANGDIHNETVKTNEVTNNEIPQTVRKTTKQVGAIKRLSVAVVVDGHTVRTVGKDGAVQSKVEAWTP
ncbi:MAG: flagellar basal-body MS-ring/collar protein FliF, partial [Bdellovibrionota bacterium]